MDGDCSGREMGRELISRKETRYIGWFAIA